jgi:UDP-N-acetylglucosamine 2-epimerase
VPVAGKNGTDTHFPAENRNQSLFSLQSLFIPERPITVELGTNVLAGTSKEGILKAYGEALEKAKHATVPPLWDGRASERIWGVII